MHMYNSMTSILRPIAAALLTLAVSGGAFAAGQHSGGHGNGKAMSIGQPGNPSDASRTVSITMTDNRYSLERVAVRKGETVRFLVKNDGKFVHEFNIGTMQMHKAHQKEMAMMFEHGVLEVDKIHRDKMKMKMPDGHTMEHDDPNSVLLEPGKSAEIVWKFNTDAKLEFACNIPGHYESGMMGDIQIK